MIGIKDALNRNSVQVLEFVPTWQDAVRVAVEPLVEAGYAEQCYIDNIIANANEYGPYFVLCPDLALLHARPDQGALKTQLGITILKQGAVFKEGADPVRVLVTLIATDGNTHIDVMRTLAQMFSEPQNIESLALCEDADAVYEKFMGYAQEVAGA